MQYPVFEGPQNNINISYNIDLWDTCAYQYICVLLSLYKK